MPEPVTTGGILLKFGGWLFSYAAKKGLDEVFDRLVKPPLKKRDIQEAFENALDAALNDFKVKYPGLYGALFDEIFLQEHAADELLKLITRTGEPDSKVIAEAYKSYFKNVEVQDIDDAIKYFIVATNNYLKKESKLQDLLSYRQTEAIHSAVHEMQPKIQEMSEQLSSLSNYIQNSPPHSFPIVDSGTINACLAAQLSSVLEGFSKEVDLGLDNIFDDIMRGNLDTCDQKLTDIRTGKNWALLAPEIQARVVRLQATLYLNRGDIDAAERFLDIADTIVTPKEPRLRALIAARRFGQEKGLEILGTPESRDGVHLKIALLLEEGNIDNAITLIDSHPTLQDDHAETFRLKAFIALMQGRLTDALSIIKRAEELNSDWPSVKRVGAIIRYACSLSPIVDFEWYYPNPVDIDLVKKDDDSQALLSEAYCRFEELAKHGQNEKVRCLDEIWSLACLCNQIDPSESAEERCLTILNRDPTNYGAIHWGLARHFAFNRENSKNALKTLLDDGKGEADHALALAWLLISENQTNEAVDVINRYSPAFKTENAILIRDKFISELTAHTETPSSHENDSPLSLVSHVSNLANKMHETKNSKDFIILFKTLFLSQKPSVIALKAAQILASADQWDAIAPYIENLLCFETAEAVHLAAYTAINTNRPRLALQILDERKKYFPSSLLPQDLRKLQVKALNLSGDLQAALNRATLLSAETSALSDNLIKANLHLQSGNIFAALPILREATKADLLSPGDALRLAPLVAIEDAHLARELVQHAKIKGIPEELSTTALDLFFRLGIEDEARPILENIGQLAQKNSEMVRLCTLEEIIEIQRHWNDSANNIYQLYLSGVIPVHFFIEQGVTQLGHLYRLVDPPLETRPAFSPIMIRHGGRPANIKVDLPFTEWRIFLDITSLIIASQLKLLDVLEQLPHPVTISPNLTRALYELEIKSPHHQPARVAALKSILDAINHKSIELIEQQPDITQVSEQDLINSSAYKTALARNCIILDHHIPACSDSEIQSKFTSVRAIVDGLHNAGELDELQYSEARDRIGTYDRDVSGVSPTPGSTVYFLTNTLTVIANASLLDAVLRTYRVLVDSSLLQMAQTDIERASQGDILAAEITTLRRRISEGIERGRYLILPTVDDSELIEEETCEDGTPKFPSSPITKCLYDFLTASPIKNSVVWVDDRNITGYQNAHNQGSPIVGIYEVLCAMRTVNLISEDTRRNALLRLRSAGFMFLPLEPGEVLEHLSKAMIRDGKVVETPALAIIRRYVARIILLEKHLKIDDGLEALKGRPAEIQLIMDVRRLAETCIVAQWSHPGLDVEVRRARSSWLWSNLRMERFERFPIGTPANGVNRTITALLFGALLTGAMQIIKGNPLDHAFERRSLYFKWIEDEVIGNRFTVDPLLLDEIVRLCTQLFVDLVEFRIADRNRPELIAEAKRHLRGIVQQIPDPIRQKMTEKVEFCQKLGIKMASIVTIGDLSFKADHLWRAFDRVFAHGKARIKTLNSKRRVEICIAPDREYTVQITGGGQYYVSDPIFGILKRTPAEREKLLNCNQNWFDMPADDRNKESNRIALMTNPAERIKVLGDLRDASAAYQYEELKNKLRNGEQISLDEFKPPSVESLLRHLRLSKNKDTPFADQLSLSAENLVSEGGLNFAFSRLSGLPYEFSDLIVKSILNVSLEDRKVLFSEIAKFILTPLQFIHALHIHRRVFGSEDIESFHSIFNKLLVSWPIEGRLFVTILKWTEAAFEHDLFWVSLSHEDRIALVWTHADRILSILKSNNIDLEFALKTLTDNSQNRSIREMLLLFPEYDNDAANPEHIDEASLLFHGIGYILDLEIASKVLDADQIETLRNLLTTESIDDRLISLWLFIRRDQVNGSLFSVFSLRPIGIFDEKSDPTEKACNQTLESALIALESDFYSSTSWLLFWTFGRRNSLPEYKVRLNKILSEIDLVELIQRGTPDKLWILRIIADCCVRLGDGETVKEIQNQFRRLAEYYSKKYPGKYSPSTSKAHPADDAITQLLEGAAALSRTDNFSQCMERLGNSIAELAYSWPGAAPAFRDVVSNVLRHLPSDESIGLWKSCVALRCLL